MFLRLAPLFAAATLLLVVASSPSYALVQSEIVNGSNMVVPYNLTAQVCVEVSAGHRATNGASLTFEVGGYDSNVLIAPYVEQTMEYSWNGGPWTIWPGSGSVWQSTVPYQVHWRFQGDRIPGAGWLKARYCQQPPKAGSILANHPFPKFTFQTWHDAADETTAIADGTQYAPSTTAAAVAAVEPTLMSLCTADAMRDVFVLGGTPYVVCAGENAPRALTTTPLACSPGEIPVFSWSDNAFVCQPAGQDRPPRWVGLDRMGTAISSDNALQAAIQGWNAGQADPNQYVARLMFSSQMESFTAECRSGADADGWPNLTSAVTFNAMCNDGTAWDPMVPVGCLPSLAANQYLKAVGLGFAGSIRELCGSYVPSFDEATGAFLCLDGATEVMRTLPDTCPTGQVFNDTRNQCETENPVADTAAWRWSGGTAVSAQAACEDQLRSIRPNDVYVTTVDSGDPLVFNCQTLVHVTTGTPRFAATYIESVTRVDRVPAPDLYIVDPQDSSGHLVDPQDLRTVCINQKTPGIPATEVGMVTRFLATGASVSCLDNSLLHQTGYIVGTLAVQSCASPEVFSTEWPGEYCTSHPIAAESDASALQCEGNLVDFSQTFASTPVDGAYEITLSADLNNAGSAHFRHRTNSGAWVESTPLAAGTNALTLPGVGLGTVELQACLADSSASDGVTTKLRNVTASLVYGGGAPQGPAFVEGALNVPADGGWHAGSYQGNVAGAAISAIQVQVQPRNYRQAITLVYGGGNVGSCIVDAASNNCEAMVSGAAIPATGAGMAEVEVHAADADFGFFAPAQIGALPLSWDLNAPTVAVPLDLSQAPLAVTQIVDGEHAMPAPPFGMQADSPTLVAVAATDGATTALPQAVPTTEVAPGVWEYRFDLSALADGVYTLDFGAADTFGNRVEQNQPDVVVDTHGPDVALTNAAAQLPLDGGELARFTDIRVTLTEALSPEATIQSVTLSDGTTTWSPPATATGTPGEYRLDVVDVYPDQGTSLALDIEAVDARGNATLAHAQFTYTVPLVAAGDTRIPATRFPLVDASGRYALYTDILKDMDGNTLAGVHDVRVKITGGPASLSIDGSITSLGNEVVIVGYDFGAAGGRFEAALAGINPANVGAYTLELRVEAPDTFRYGFAVEVWVPTLAIDVSSANPRIVADLFQATVREASGQCTLTTDLAVARAADPIREPVCYLDTALTPFNATFNADDRFGQLRLQRRFFADEQGTLAFNLEIADDLGNRAVVASASTDIDVDANAAGLFALTPSRDFSELMAGISQVRAAMADSVGAVPCRFGETSEEALGIADPEEVASVACVLSWTAMPVGLNATLLAESVELTGAVDIGPQVLAWQVTAHSASGASVEIENGSYAIEGTAPRPIDLTLLLDNPEEVTPADATAVDEDRGVLGRWEVEMYPANVVVQLRSVPGDVLLSESTVNAIAGASAAPTTTIRKMGSMRLDPAQLPALDDVTDIRVVAFYEGLPAMTTEQTFTAWTSLRDTVVPELSTAANAYLNTDVVTFDVKLVDSRLGADYTPRATESWQVRLLHQRTYRDYTPLSDWQPMAANGTVSTVLDLAGLESNNFRVVAEARWMHASPVGNFAPRKSRNLAQVAILNGEPIDSAISSGKLTGPAPLRTYLKVTPTDSVDRLSIGAVTWEIRDLDAGTGWTPMVSDYPNTTVTMYQTFQRGRYEVRATIENRNSGAQFTTPAVEVIAYYVPTIQVDAPTTVMRFPDQPTSVTLTGQSDALEPLVWEWSTDNGQSWSAGVDTFDLTLPTPEGTVGYANMYVVARARFPDAPPADPFSWATRKVGVRFTPMSRPYVRITGPYRVEIGQPQTYSGRATPPFRGLGNAIFGEFVLPDGTPVPGDELTFTPTPADVVDGKVTVTYRATIEGFEAYGLTAELAIAAGVWEYVWPSFALYGKPRFQYAPSTVQLYARQEGSRYPLDGDTYVWRLPPQATVLQDAYEDRRVVEINEPGTYTFEVDIADARGNATTESYTVTLSAPPPMDAGIAIYKSNQYDREPLGLTMRAVASGGHPGDRVQNIAFSVDGQPLASAGTFARTELMQGMHTVEVVLTTQSGLEYGASESVEVMANTPPTCAVTRVEYLSSWMYTANCNDPDGRMTRYEWSVDGTPTGSSSGRITISKYGVQVEPAIELVGYDDSGAASPPASP